jgi:hypothetical protein
LIHFAMSGGKIGIPQRFSMTPFIDFTPARRAALQEILCHSVLEIGWRMARIMGVRGIHGL